MPECTHCLNAATLPKSHPYRLALLWSSSGGCARGGAGSASGSGGLGGGPAQSQQELRERIGDAIDAFRRQRGLTDAALHAAHCCGGGECRGFTHLGADVWICGSTGSHLGPCLLRVFEVHVFVMCSVAYGFLSAILVAPWQGSMWGCQQQPTHCLDSPCDAAQQRATGSGLLRRQLRVLPVLLWRFTRVYCAHLGNRRRHRLSLVCTAAAVSHGAAGYVHRCGENCREREVDDITNNLVCPISGRWVARGLL
jgi:hypothetical protein